MLISQRGTIILPCTKCKSEVDTGVTLAEFKAYAGGGQSIQIALPNIPAEMREMFISGICGPCFDQVCSEDIEDYFDPHWEDDSPD